MISLALRLLVSPKRQELRRSRVELIVAPYEADAQLAYLSRSGLVHAVITEDSDCLPYGCKKVPYSRMPWCNLAQ